MHCLLRFSLVVCLVAVALTLRLDAAEPLKFNREVRPILAENCFYCHGQDENKRQADLRLDVRDVAVEAGAIVPKDVAASAMIERINSTDPDEVMRSLTFTIVED